MTPAAPLTASPAVTPASTAPSAAPAEAAPAYDPSAKQLALSPDNYHGTSLAAVGIAAHEAGHAIQHKVGMQSSENVLAINKDENAPIFEFAEHWWRTWDAKGRLLPGTIPYRKGEVMRCVPELTLWRS